MTCDSSAMMFHQAADHGVVRELKASSPPQTNSAEVPYPRPTSIARPARSRMTQDRIATPSVATIPVA